MRLEAHDPSTWERMERFNAGMYVRAPACANVSAVHARGASQTGMWGGGGRYWLRACYGEINFRFRLYHVDRPRRPKLLTYQVTFDPEKAREEEDEGNEAMNEV
jgi:hypothetical protein